MEIHPQRAQLEPSEAKVPRCQGASSTEAKRGKAVFVMRRLAGSQHRITYLTEFSGLFFRDNLHASVLHFSF